MGKGGRGGTDPGGGGIDPGLCGNQKFTAPSCQIVTSTSNEPDALVDFHTA